MIENKTHYNLTFFYIIYLKNDYISLRIDYMLYDL